MTDNDFTGKLDSIDPSSIITDGTKDDLADFLLVLAAIYNDIKGLFFFNILLDQNYRIPKSEEISSHSGEYGGLRLQLYKLILATVHEFFRFLKENSQILNSEQFITILKKLSESDRKKWNEIVEVAIGEDQTNSNFRKTLSRIRDNITSHYYESDKNLRKGFISRFFKTEKSRKMKNDAAYFSLSESMQGTRFYYADASAQEFVYGFSKTAEIDNPVLYQKAIVDILKQMNITIALILKNYLENLSAEEKHK